MIICFEEGEGDLIVFREFELTRFNSHRWIEELNNFE